MSFNGSGTFNLTSGNPVVTGTTISSTWANNTLSDIATGLSNCITRDGQSPATANLPMGGYKFTGLAAGSANGDSVRYEQVTSAVAITGGSINGTTIGASTASTGAFTTLSASSTVTLSGGTANGVLYLDGSKVATSGSALVFDGTNLGIGTSSPGAKLDVYGGAGAATSFVRAASGQNAFFSVIGNGNTFLSTSLDIIQDSTNAASIFQRANAPLLFGTNNAERMRIDSSGNVGIGTSSPSSYGRLAVMTPTANYGYFGITNSVAGAGGVGMAQYYGTTKISYIDVCLTNGAPGSETAYMAFATNNAGTLAERMRIDSSGNLLVGRTDVQGNGGGGIIVTSSSATNANNYMLMTSTSYAESLLVFDCRTTAGSGYNFVYAKAGSGGTGQFKISGNGVIYAQNTTVQSISDCRLKENVRDSIEGLDVITALRAVRFDWKEGYGNDRKNQLGFIAQEVEQVFPDAVDEWKDIKEDDDTVYKTVGPAALIPVLVKAIQELSAKVAELEAKLK